MRYFNSVKDTNCSGNCRFSPKKTARINWLKNCLSSLLWLTSLWLAHISHKDVGHHRQVGLPPMGSGQTQARITLIDSKQNVIFIPRFSWGGSPLSPQKAKVALYELRKTELISVISWINNRIITSDDKGNNRPIKMTHNDFKNPDLM